MAGRSKNSQVILLDVSKDMHPHLGNISEVLSGHLASKMVNSPNHQVGLVLYGTKGTDNNVQRELGDPTQYQHIEEAWQLKPPGKDEITQSQALPRGTGSAELCDALVVAIDLFIRAAAASGAKPGKAASSSSIVVLSSFMSESPEQPDTEFLSSVVERMHEHGITLEVLQLQLGSEGPPPPAKMAALEHLLSELSNARVRKARSTAELLSCFRAKEVAPTTLFRGPLAFTPGFDIPVWVYKKTMEVKMPSMKKYSDSLPQSEPSASHDVSVETEYKSTTNPDLPEVPVEERVKGIPYGRQLVPMQEAEERYLKFTVEKAFRVIGFVDADQAPRHQYMADANVVVPLPDNEKAALALSAVVRAMARTGKVAIARAAWRANSTSVILGALTPFPGTVQRADCLLFNALPFMEDSRSFTFSSFDNPKVRPSKEQYKAADALMKGMSLDGAGEDLLRPEDTVNPSIAYLNQQLAARMSGAEPTPGGSDSLRSLLAAPKSLREAPQVLEAARALCPAAAPGTAATQDSTQGAVTPSGLMVSGDPPSQRRQRPSQGAAEPGAAAEAANAEPQPKRLKVGTSAPLHDFEEMMQHDATKGAALSGMREAIVALVNDSIGDRFYKTALSCIVALRGASVKLGAAESDRFNEFMRDTKSRFLAADAGRDDFLAQVARAKVTLVTGEEVPGCLAGPGDAEEWLKMEAQRDVGKGKDADASAEAVSAEGAGGAGASVKIDEDEFDDMD